MKTTLFYAITGGAVNRDTGIISGVSVITEGEAKGHGVKIDRKTLESFKACADQFPGGVQVKSDHGTGFASIVGVLENFRIDGAKLLADLRMVKSDSQYTKTMDLAESMPSVFGLSPSFSLKTEKIGGEDYARCEDLYSVDLVDRPAANPSGLFAVDSRTNAMTLAELIPGMFGKDGTVTELQTTIAKLRTDFAASQAEAVTLKAELAKRDTDLAAIVKQRDEFKATIEKPDGEIEKRAGLKAKELMASLGQPPLPTNPGAKGAEDMLAQFEAIKDPVARTAFYRANKAAYDAAFSARLNEPKK